MALTKEEIRELTLLALVMPGRAENAELEAETDAEENDTDHEPV